MSNLTKLSKTVALILRHAPQVAGVQVDENGWVCVTELIDGINTHTDKRIDLPTLEMIVALDKKRRFAFSVDKSKIRANQGHSIPVDLQMREAVPPELLFHGTAEKYLESILRDGIKKQRRNFVHLSSTVGIALSVGKRHGTPIALVIDTAAMLRDGYKFLLSDNGVWQSEDIPRKYIKDVRYC